MLLPYSCTHQNCSYHAPCQGATAACTAPQQQDIMGKALGVQHSSLRIERLNGFIVILTDVLTCIFLVSSLYARRYHFTSTCLVTGSIIHFDIGLMSVRVSGNPRGFLSKLQPRFVTDLLVTMTQSGGERSLAEFEAYACFTDTLFASLLPSGCATIVAVRVASLVLISCFIISIFLLIAGALSLFLLLVGSLSHTYFAVRVVFFFHMIPSFLTFASCFLYLLLGGLDLNLVPQIPFLIADINYVDLGSGFFWAVGASIVTLLVPVLVYFTVYSKSCAHPDRIFDAYETQETDLLVDELRAARGLPPFTTYSQNGAYYVQ